MTARIINGLSFEEYAALPGLNATAIKAGAHSMRRMHRCMRGLLKKDSPALEMGRLIHAAALEPDKVLSTIAVWEGAAKRGKAWDEFKIEHSDMLIISLTEREQLQSSLRGLYANKTAMRLIDESAHEVTVVWSDKILGECKCRADGLSDKCLIEVKSSAQISKRAFGRKFFDLGYDLGAGWYFDGCSRLADYPPDLPVKMIVIDTTGDEDCYVIDPLPSDVVREGRKAAREIAARYRACQAVGVYPGVSEGDCCELEIPSWRTGGELPPSETMEASEI